MGYNIPALEKLIDEFRKMPSVGTKSAERMEGAILIIFLPLLEGKFRIPW